MWLLQFHQKTTLPYLQKVCAWRVRAVIGWKTLIKPEKKNNVSKTKNKTSDPRLSKFLLTHWRMQRKTSARREHSPSQSSKRKHVIGGWLFAVSNFSYWRMPLITFGERRRDQRQVRSHGAFGSSAPSIFMPLKFFVPPKFCCEQKNLFWRYN